MGNEVNGLAERLFQRRHILVLGAITEELFGRVFTQLLTLDDENPNEPIWMWISSAGGSVYDLLSMVDLMRAIRSLVATIALDAFSAAAVLLAAGSKGYRFCTPNSTVMLHRSEVGGAPGRGNELASFGRHYQDLDRRTIQLLAETTGQSARRIGRDRERGLWLDAEGAIAYGLADRMLRGPGDLWPA